MAAATERIPVLVTEVEKVRIVAAAKAAGLSTGEFLRRAASSYRTSDEEAAVASLLAKVHETTARAGKAIDRALAEVAASNRRIAALERGASKAKRGLAR